MKRKVNFGTGLVGLCTALLWVNSASCQAQSAPTVEDFDGVHTHYNIYQLNPASTAPTIIPNGMSGNCLRLATDSTVTSDNTITFDRTAGGVFSQIVAEFDFRITLGNNGRADGLGFALAHLNNKGPDGKVVLNLPEQPDLADSLGVGFDIYDDAHPNPNYVSVHFNQANIVQRDAGFDLASGQFIHARIVMQPGGNSSNVSVFLTPPGGTEVSIINQYPVPGFTSYPNCGVFGARCGGQSANFDLDNINVSYVSPPAAPVSGFFQFVKTPGDRFIGYAPYRTTPTTASITADLQLLSRYFNGLILYGTDMTDLGGNHPMSAWIMSEAKRLGFGAVILGINDPTNSSEVNNAADLILQYNTSLALAVCIGNERIYRGLDTTTDLAQLNAAQAQLNDRLGSVRVPVSTSETLTQYQGDHTNNPNVGNFGDFLLPNIYGFYDQSQPRPVEAAEWARSQGALISDSFGKIVLVKETGWPTAGGTNASEENQRQFFAAYANGPQFFDASSPAVPTTTFAAFNAAFEAFDQPNKSGSTFEPYFGIFKADQTFKPAVDTFPILPALILNVATNPTTNPVTFSETAGENAATGTVTRNTPTDADMIVNLTSSDTSKVTVPATVTIPAGQTSATFPISAVDNTIADGRQTVTITASQTGFMSGTASVIVTDNDVATLTLSVATNPVTNPVSFSEGAGTNAATGTVTRNTPTDTALNVNLASTSTDNRPVRASVPATVTIPADQTSVTFSIAAIDNAIADGSQTVAFTASAPGFTDGTAQATVMDNDIPQLGLSIPAGPLTEGGTLTATLTRNTLTDAALTVNVSSNPAGIVSLPSTVTIPAGQAAANFTIAQPDDAIAYGPRSVNIAVSKDGFTPASGTINLADNDIPALTLTLNAANVVEGGSITGTVTRNTPPSNDLPVTLASSNAAIPVPTGVTIPIGQMSATFTISTANDAVAQGDRSTTITATAGTLTDKKPFTVVDDDGPAALTLSISPTTFAENGSATATVTRNTPTDIALDVTVTTSDANVASVPATVTIPAGSNFASFSINGVSNHTVDNSHTAVISASSGGLTATPVTVTVTNSDVAPPVPTISSIAPASGPVGAQVTITGTNLSGATVKFGTVLAVVDAESSSDTKLVVTVPNDVSVGNTTITITTGNGSTNHAFTVTKLTSFTISGSVLTKVGTAGKPVTGVKVVLLPLKVTGTPTASAIQDAVLDFLTSPATFKPVPVVVDSNGNYSFSQLAAGTYVVAPYKVGTSFKSATAPGLPYQVITLSTKNAVNVNFVVSTTETTKPQVTVTTPTNNATFTAAKVPAAKGAVADTSGILGVGVVLARLNSASPTSLNLSLYNWTTNKFDAAFTLSSTANLFTKVLPAEIKAATVAGNGWTTPLPLNLAIGTYRVIPFAVDKNFNIGYPLPVGTTLLMGNFKVGAATRSLDEPQPAVVKLSTAKAQAATNSIQLRFLAALDTDTASDVSHYSVTLNGQLVVVESAGYNASTHTVILGLTEGNLRTGDKISVQWNDLVDAQGNVCAGQSGTLTAG